MSAQSDVRQHLSRRHFLALGAVGAALPWAGGLAQAAQAPAAVVEPLSVGFLEGSDQLSLHYDHMKWSIPKKMSAAEPESLPVLPADIFLGMLHFM